MKYFIAKKFYSTFYQEVTNTNYINQIKSHDDLKVGESISLLDRGVNFTVNLAEIKGNELYFEY